MNKILEKSFLFVLMGIIFTSCVSSIKDPKNIPTAMDYTDEIVIQNEIERINKMKDVEPVKAMFRSILLGNEKVIDSCTEIVSLKMQDALENNDYFQAKKYYTSLQAVGYELDPKITEELASKEYSDVPGFGENQKEPESIQNCLNATATIWVDRGVRIENGAGFSDVVIGSGFFIDKRGYLVTNHHVIESMVDSKYEGYSRLFIKLLSNPDEKIPAKVIGYDPMMDLALLKAEIEPEYIFNLGSSEDLSVGDNISVIGAPLGLEGTVTSGIISTIDRKMLSSGNVFQIDAAVNSGNSGGPLIDSALKVQAIVFAGIVKFQGLNFAIPVEYLKQELPRLYKSEENEIIHPWIGCYGHTKRTGSEKVGLEVQYIMPGSSASFSGLQVDDVIVEVGGTKIQQLEDLNFLFMGFENETILQCKYLRDEEEKTCLLYLEKRPEKPFVQISNSDFVYNTFVPAFGIKMVPSSSTNRNTYKIERVIRGTTSDQMSFSENDMIQIKEVKMDTENSVFYAIINTERQKKGCLDIIMTLGTSFDSPYYF